MEETTYQGSTHLGRLRMPALAVGVLGLIACAAGFFLDHDQFFRSWLIAFLQIEPQLDPLRDDRRYLDLLNRVESGG